MHGPEPVAWLLAALCCGIGVYCGLGVRAGPSRQRQAAGIEAAMGVGMAVMAVPSAALPPPPPGVFLVLFSALAAWSGALLGAGECHQAHHLVESLAMVYMAWVMTTASAGHAAHSASSGPAGHGPGGVPVLTAGLLVYFALYALRAGPQLLPAAPGGGGAGAGTAGHGPPGSPAAPPEVAAGCRLAMALAMFAMLMTL